MVKNSPANAGDERDAGSIPGREEPLNEGILKPTPAFMPGESHGQRSLVGYGPQGRRDRHD